MMSICSCYRDERGVCYGTKEKEPCSCGGNPVKCDFYKEVREKYIYRTNIEEAYNWRDDIMEITRRIVYETDKARLNNIAEHFEVDLSEIREFLEMKRKKMQKPQTNNVFDGDLSDA